MKVDTQSRFSVTIYSADLGMAKSMLKYAGVIIEKSTGKRHVTKFFRDKQDCENACSKWIDEHEEN